MPEKGGLTVSGGSFQKSAIGLQPDGTYLHGYRRFKNGLRYGHLAVDALVELNDTSVVAATTYNRLAVTYSKMDRLETALDLLQKALTFSLKNNWDDGTVQILANIIDLSIKKGIQMNPQIAFLERFLANNYDRITPYVKYTIEEGLRMFFIKSKNIYKSKFYLDKCFQ